MARSKNEISDALKSSFVANPILKEIYGLTDNLSFNEEFSLVSLEAQIIEIIATSGKTIEDLMDEHHNEINQRYLNLMPGTLNWYRQLALNFQIGDAVVWNSDTLKYEYSVIDDSKKIIKLASVNETETGLLFKVAKLVNGFPSELSPIELAAFRAYLEKMKYAGVNIVYVSRSADLINLNLRVYIDPQILALNGTLISNPLVSPVVNAVDEFLKLLPFNGVFSVTALVDHLQKVSGVVNPVFLSGATTFGANPWVNINDYYLPNSGYLKINTLNVEYVW